MIIHGPDKVSSAPPRSSVRPPSDAASASATGDSRADRPTTTPNDPGNSAADGDPPDSDPGDDQPAWPPMAGDPTAVNTGVPAGANLGDHYGDLRVTTPGQVISDLRVTGAVIVDAPNVTLVAGHR
ncbi:MAG: hypothetical protein LC635_04190 [Pseudonocardiaceae bacterium]|nr:hypothetical protein [Pseudonocardiaceae bacterium]